MKQTNFATALNYFLTDYLVNKRGSSSQTIDSYRYTFIFLLDYFKEVLEISAEHINIKDLTYENISYFLDWLEEKKNNKPITRNQRQAAIKNFIHFLSYEYPEYLNEYQKILGIPLKKSPQKEISYLKTDGISVLMHSVDINKTCGLRDYVILMLLCTTGIRVSELINIQVKDISLHKPYTLLVHGKGQKSRYVPVFKDSIAVLQKYLKHMEYLNPSKSEEWLFINHMNRKFTRQGINYIIQKYGKLAHKVSPELVPQNLSPHKLRHTVAMGLVDSGVDLIYIRDLLGHISVRTTEIYARADAKLKRKAIEAASKELTPPEKAK